jgi:hypothetical protein
MMEGKKQYYGDKEIESIGDANAEGLHLVTFTDKTTEELSKMILSEAVSDKSVDLTELRNKRCFPVVAKILEVLRDANVRISEIDFITQRVIMSIDESREVGNTKVWGGIRADQQTMRQLERVLVTKEEGGIPSPFPTKE